MDLHPPAHFVVAAEESNFRRAAARLETNQSIIARHVRDIEDELGADLFQREPGLG
jgi:DNA-binding transcriptional LysR family regulator